MFHWVLQDRVTWREVLKVKFSYVDEFLMSLINIDSIDFFHFIFSSYANFNSTKNLFSDACVLPTTYHRLSTRTGVLLPGIRNGTGTGSLGRQDFKQWR